MKQKMLRVGAVAVIALAAGGIGYTMSGGAPSGACVSVQAQTVTAPALGTVRVIYSLDKKQNDKELIALIADAHDRIYFAIYTFTLSSVADALIAAKGRGVDVRGVLDMSQATGSYGAPILKELQDAGIPIVFEKHLTGNGIMHIKTLVTEKAYATGSYNWTSSATTINDEILEIGTDSGLRQAYENILRQLFTAYAGNTAAANAAANVSIGTIDYTEAPKHIGEVAYVHATLMRAYTSKSGTVFLDFCKDYKTCPFSAVIFADDAKKFGDLSRYTGKTVTISGKISSYQGKAEIVLSSPSQLAK